MPAPDEIAAAERRSSAWVAGLFLVGTALSLLMLSRSQVAADQLALLARGWLLAFEGEWVHYGNPNSAGGAVPGGATSLLIGLPLLLWSHHRAPTLLILALHVLGYLLLDRLVARTLGPKGRVVFAALYWLNPWRVYHSAFLWNPNHLFFFGALHLWTLWQLRERGRFWVSLLHVLSIGIAFQLHPSAVVLAVLSCLLYWRGYFTLRWAGVLAGGLVLGAFAVPWLLTVLQDPALLPGGPQPWERGARVLHSGLRGAGFWLRYPSFAMSTPELCFDFSAWLGPQGMERLEPALAAGKHVLRLLTLPLALWVNLRLWRGSAGWWRRLPAPASAREWIEGVVRWAFVSVVLACLISPATPMSWHLLIALQLAVLPGVLACTDLLQGRRARQTARWIAAYTLLGLLLLVAIAFGSPVFRCGGERCGALYVTLPELRSDHPMLDELGIQASCPVVVDRPGGAWIGLLPEGGEE